MQDNLAPSKRKFLGGVAKKPTSDISNLETPIDEPLRER